VRVGALVEDQEAGVHAVGDPVQRDVHRVGVAAESSAGLEQRDLGLPDQRMATARPEMPEPTTATRFIGSPPDMKGVRLGQHPWV
jgi:hypothetical protein